MNDEKQISVSYIGDLAHTPPEDVLLVERDKDYVRACRELSITEASTSGLKVWVRSKNHFAWLRDFAEQIGCPAVFSEKKHRFAALGEKQVGEIPDNLWELGYKFKQPYVPDSRVFFLPRGHNTVRQSGKAKGFLHGGVTPEEVVVPTALYKLVEAAWKTPVARFLDLDLIRETGRAKFYIQRVVTVKIELLNLNTVDIRVLRASVASPETDLKNCDVGIIPAGSVNTIQMNCYFKKAALGEKNLEIEIAYEISGEQHTLTLTLKCEFKSAMAGGFSLRDL